MKVSSLIEDNIEDDHDTNHRVEGDQSSHGREFSVIVNDHEGKEDENSGHKVHQHLHHQHDNVRSVQGFVFVLVTKEYFYFNRNIKEFKPYFINGKSDSDE